jgi:hypothetical protein
MKSPAFTERNAADSTGRAGAAAPVTWPTGQNSLACETPVSFRETRYGWLVMTVVWAISVAYLAVYLRTGWFPYDAGHLAEAAERVLHGASALPLDTQPREGKNGKAGLW